ncbi:MAG: hypothetical protein K0S09_3219 [Sphingobacteriaceae bacterium]|jgi:hypothetical protein|nr:hypothetical protein [Sphingobacteriaceae bacterium]
MRLLFFGLALFACTNLYATNYYVSSKKGSPENSGKSPGQAKRTIQEAANLTKAGDTVLVMNGTYFNDCSSCNVVDIPVSGTKSAYIIYKNYPGHSPVISFNGWAGFSIAKNISYIKITGFEIIGNNENVSLRKAIKQPGSCDNKEGEYDPAFNGNGIAISGKQGQHPHHIEILNNVIHDCGGGGIGASQADYITAEGNTIYNTSWYTVFGTSGISFYQFWNFDQANGYHNIIRNNKCYNNRNFVKWADLCRIADGNGIIIDDFRNEQNGSSLGPYHGRTLIENNICWFNGGTGIHTFQSDHVDIFNNTAYRNAQSRELEVGQIQAGVSGDIRIVNNILVTDRDKLINYNFKNSDLVYRNNLHYNVNRRKVQTAITNVTCTENVDPMFEKPSKNIRADFRLKLRSPAVNCGNPEIYSPFDYTGIKRPVREEPDIGAFEQR